MDAASDFISALQSPVPAHGAAMDVDFLLAQLPANYRQVIELFYLEQKAYEEVSAMLGLPIGTVKTLLFRAKRELVRINARQPKSVATQAAPPQSRAMRTPVAPAAAGDLPKIEPLTGFSLL
jgi:RNA polymerase sigma-70 factor (ECF subfamily)